ncbi:TPA: hypothetical protein NPN76_005079, partial [Klebsiella variicola subsp. variicola]|nr:hypothetical protein [Klebsiella variicola subsp. variicola]
KDSEIKNKNLVYTESAAERLIKVKNSSGFLSDDVVFFNNVDGLLSKLDILKQHK